MTATPVTSITAASGQRLEVLDGLRGLAALMVVAFHLLARWAEPMFYPTIYPHGDALATFLPLQVAGQVGVNLFFLISGFVIMMTLEKTTGLADFTIRRAARLWPAMIFCASLSTILINASGIAYVYENVARWQVTPVEYFSSIVFIPPDFTAAIFGIEQADRPRWVEGVYWTLWCEVRFYALVALAYWISPRALFLWVWAGLQALSLGLDTMIEAAMPLSSGLWSLGLVVQPEMLGWFTLGLVSWKWREPGQRLVLSLLAIMASIAILFGTILIIGPGGVEFASFAPRNAVMLAMAGLPFIMFLTGSPLLKPLTWKPVIAIGLASYPLYLFHERPGMIYLHWLNSANIPPWVALVIVFALLIATALLIHKLVEMPSQRFILARFLSGAGRLQARFGLLRMPGHRLKPPPAQGN